MKQFKVARSAKEGVRFKIDNDEFVALPAEDLPGGILLDLGAAASGNPQEQSLALLSFLRLALEPDSVDLLERRLRDPRNPIPLTMIGEVAGWLMEEVYGRPTEPSVPSGNGRQSNGAKSTAGASAKGSATRSPSPDTDS